MKAENRTAQLIVTLLLIQTLLSVLIVLRLEGLMSRPPGRGGPPGLLSEEIFEVAVGDSPSQGSAEASVTIVEFSDFTCGACRRAQSTLDSLLETHGDSVRLVFKYFPLRPQGKSMTFALAAECARRQGSFWSMHDAIFRSTQELAEPDDFLALAERLGLERSVFGTCLAASDPRATVERDLQAGRALGVSGTPTFFINGRRMRGVPALSDLVEAVESVDSARRPK